MARKEYQEEGLRLYYELAGVKNAERYNKLNEEIAKRAEDTAQRVEAAGKRMAAALGHPFAGKGAASKGLYDWIGLQREEMASIGAALPATDISDWITQMRDLQRISEQSLGGATAALYNWIDAQRSITLPSESIDSWITGLRGLGNIQQFGGLPPQEDFYFPARLRKEGFASDAAIKEAIEATNAKIAGQMGALQPRTDWMLNEVLRKPTYAATDDVMEAIGATGQAVAGWPAPGSGTVGKWALLDKTFEKVKTSAGEMLVDTESGFYKWKKSQDEAASNWLSVGPKLVAQYAAISAAAYAAGRAVGRAFEQMEEAAQKRAMREALISMGNTFGTQSGRIVEALIEISDQTLSTAQAISVTNQALIAGARPFAESVPRLFEIARASAVATGKDVMWVFDTLVRGIARAEPRLIDNANIYLSVTEAAREMAEADGELYDELDRQERMLYALNAVLQEGEVLIDSVSQEALDAQQPFQELRAEVSDLTDAFWTGVTAGGWFDKRLNDIADSARDAQKPVGKLGIAVGFLAANISPLEALKDPQAYVARLVASLYGLDEAVEEVEQSIGEFGHEVQLIPGWMQDVNKAIKKSGEGLGDLPDEYQRYLEQLYRLEEDSFRDRLKAGQDFADDIIDLERDLIEDRTDIWRDYYDEVADINRDYGDKIADIDYESRQREQEAVDDFNDRREDATRDHRMALIRIERDYREEVLRIEEDYQMELWEAVGERDATAALKAKRQRNLSLRRAGRDRSRAITEENEDYASQIADLKDSLEDRRKAARDYRRDERREAQRWRDRQLRDAKTDRDRDLRDLQDSYQKRLAELKDHHGDRLQEIATQYAFERRLADIEYQYREDALARHLRMMQLIRDQYAYGGTGAMPGPTGIAGYGPGGTAPAGGTAPSGPTGVPGYGPGADSVGAEADAFAQYQNELDDLESAIAGLTEMSGENWEERTDDIYDYLDDQLTGQDDYQDESESGQADHHRDQLRLQNDYFRSDARATGRYEHDSLRMQTRWDRTQRGYYQTHLQYMLRILYDYWLTRRMENVSNYYREIDAARTHYTRVEQEYKGHLRRLWILYNLFGTPPAPTPGVPEVVGKYAAETSAAERHYRQVENMYKRHLKSLWSTYDRVGVPGGSGGIDRLGGRRVPEPLSRTSAVDLSSLNLNHAVSVAVRNELHGLDGQITGEVSRVMSRLLG